MQKYKPKRLFYRKTNIDEFIVDETQIKVGSELIWLWIAIESKDKEILSISISKERNMFVAERFPANLLKEYGKHCFNRWWNLVSSSMSVSETKSSSTFSI